MIGVFAQTDTLRGQVEIWSRYILVSNMLNFELFCDKYIGIPALFT